MQHRLARCGIRFTVNGTQSRTDVLCCLSANRWFVCCTGWHVTMNGNIIGNWNGSVIAELSREEDKAKLIHRLGWSSLPG